MLYLKCVCGWTICFIGSTGTVWHKVADKLRAKAGSVLLFIFHRERNVLSKSTAEENIKQILKYPKLKFVHQLHSLAQRCRLTKAHIMFYRKSCYRTFFLPQTNSPKMFFEHFCNFHLALCPPVPTSMCCRMLRSAGLCWCWFRT